MSGGHGWRALAVVVLIAPAAARADTDPAAAEALFRSARDALAAGRVDEACRAFAESQRLDPGTGTLLNLAVCHERQGKLALAWSEFIEARAQAAQVQRVDRIALADTHLAAIEPRLGRVAVTGLASGATVDLDGVVVGRLAAADRLPVDPGAHVLTVRQPGKRPWQHRFEAASGAVVAVAAPALPDLPSPPSRVPWITGAAVSGGALVVGTGFAIDAIINKRAADAACDPSGECTSAGLAADARYQRAALRADIAFGGALLGAVVTGALYWRYRQRAVIAVTPSGGTGGAMIWLEGPL